jgi:hypothetical protein
VFKGRAQVRQRWTGAAKRLMQVSHSGFSGQLRQMAQRLGSQRHKASGWGLRKSFAVLGDVRVLDCPVSLGSNNSLNSLNTMKSIYCRHPLSDKPMLLVSGLTLPFY